MTLFAAGLIGAFVVYLLLGGFVERTFFGGRSYLFHVVWLLVYGGGVFGMIVLLRRWFVAPFVYEELRRRGHEVCVRCGYPLRGLDDSEEACPECGAARVGMAGGRLDG